LSSLGFFKQKQTSSSFSLLTKYTTGQDKEAASYKTLPLLIDLLKKVTSSVVKNLTYPFQKFSEVFCFGFFNPCIAN